MNKILFVILFLSCFTKLSAQKGTSTSLGIPNFTILGNAQDIEKYKWLEVGFSESLTDAFSRVPEFSLIERNQLIKIINEQNLQNTKQIDTLSIVKVGKILGVKQILIGSCQIITGHTLVNMRIVDVETGEVKPLRNLPTIVTPIDSVLFLQKRLCLEVLRQFDVKNENQVISQIESVTSRSTNNVKAYEFLNKGLALFNNGQFDDAIEMYNNALIIDKKYQKAYYNRGQSKIKINNYSDAIDDYKQVDNYMRKDSIYSLIGYAYIKQGNKEKSTEYLLKAQKINPNNIYVKKLLSEISNNRQTFLNQQANTNFETVYIYNNGIARAKKNKKYGFIDVNGKVVIPLIYDDLRDFKNGLAAAKINSKWGFINENGSLAIEAKYSEVSNFDKYKLARVVNKDKWGMINSKGEIIMPIEFFNDTFYSDWESSDLMVVTKFNGLLGLNYSEGVYDRNGNLVIPTIYDNIYITHIVDENKQHIKHEIYASLNSKWGMIDSKNKIIIPFVYESRDCIRGFENEFAAVKVNERWGFVNGKGILVIPTSYEQVNDFNGKMFEVRNKGKWGLIDLNFNEIIPCEYESIELDPKEYYKLKKENKWGIFGLNNIQILPCEYENVDFLSKSYFRVKKNGKIGVVDRNNKSVIDLIYEDVKYITFELLAVKKNNKWGIIDNGNNIVCDFKYDNVNHFSVEKSNKNKDLIYVQVEFNGKEILIDTKCKCVYNCK